MHIMSVPAEALASIVPIPKNPGQADSARRSEKTRSHRRPDDGEVTAPQIATAAASAGTVTALNLLA